MPERQRLDLPTAQQIHCWWLPYLRSQGHAPLIRILSRYLPLDPAEIELAREPRGRPYIKNRLPQVLDFNWSHSGQHAVIAIGVDVRLGIDIEAHRPRARMQALADRYFAESESIGLRQIHDPELHAQSFWALWTGKEAVLKAIGDGISYGLERVVLATDRPGWPLHTMAEGHHDWQLQRPQLAPNYSAAVAWRGAPREVVILDAES